MPDVGPTPARILLVISDQWIRVLLRAELLERGYDAVGAESLDQALAYDAWDVERGPVGLILIDQLMLGSGDEQALRRLTRKHAEATTALLTSKQSQRPTGGWANVIERPARMGDIASRLEAIFHRSPALALRLPEHFPVRRDPPWPTISCARCHATRHYESPRSDVERRALEVDMRKFIREHRACRSSGPLVESSASSARP
jgi:DNA-binding response OmpR family regulator